MASNGKNPEVQKSEDLVYKSNIPLTASLPNNIDPSLQDHDISYNTIQISAKSLKFMKKSILDKFHSKSFKVILNVK